MVIAYAGFSTIIKTELFLGTVTSITNEQLSTIFRREVVVDGISGNYLSDIRLNSIDIASFDQIENGRLMHIEGMELQLSILQILLHRGDVLAGIKRIDIDSVDIQVLRTQNDRWNILDFLIPPPVPEGEPIPPPPNLKAEIHIKHLFGEFVDYKGWGKTLPEQPYIFDLSSAEVKLDFKDREKVPISISGLFDGGALQMAGHLNIFNGQYQFDFSLSEQNPSRWGHYVLPTAGYELRGAQLNMVGEMQSKSPFPKQGIPFNFNTTITATNSELKTPFFEEPIRQIAGTAQFNNTERLQFQILSMRGQLHEQPFHGLGHFYLADSMVSLSFKSPKFEISTVDKLFPSLREWKLNGTGDGQAVLAGHLQAPAFTGYFETETLSTAIGSIEDARVSFKRQESKLDLVANDGRFHQGTVSGKMHIQFQAPAPSTFQSSIRVQDINVSDFL